eukprot:6509925-Alexandrium_andersonii.AAC.1
MQEEAAHKVGSDSDEVSKARVCLMQKLIAGSSEGSGEVAQAIDVLTAMASQAAKVPCPATPTPSV